MEQETFTSLFKDIITHLYDHAAIETHPLAVHFPPPSDPSRQRAEAIQKLVLDEIEKLRPAGKEPIHQSPEWRPYLILYKRYIQGENPADIASMLYIGERQFRRDHSRALQALSIRIWERYFGPEKRKTPEGESSASDEQEEFTLRPEQLELKEVLRGIETILSQRLNSERLELNLDLPAHPIPILADRVLLRQILLSLINYSLHLCTGQTLKLNAGCQANEIIVSICFETDEQWSASLPEGKDLLNFVRSWSQRLRAHVEEHYPPRGQAGDVNLKLVFLAARQKVLVVDDQTATIKMFERYLRLSDIEVVGLTDPAQVVEMARQIQPVLITLDVMMPQMDGWEVLQSLQLDLQTRRIPVLVCSAWDEPELAYSLGAAAFLKKPIVQRAFFDVLTQLNLLQE